ncbi:MAG TPA: PAS domain S-box protein, partial [Thermoanaerobaculia bacterium]|nr:PAS domain S-box protein [Thermoanaerobaculia bacterium]
MLRLREVLGCGKGLRCRLACCDSVGEALAVLSHGRGPDAILLFVRRATAADMEALVALAKDQEATPLVVIGEGGDRTTERLALASGAQDFLELDDLSTPLLERSIQYSIERKNTEGARRKAEKRYRTLFEAAPDAIVLIGGGGRILDLNPSAERLLHYERQELVGKPVETIVPERAREAHRQHRERYHSSPLPTLGERPLTARRKDGSVIEVDIRLSPMVEEGQTLVIGSLVDISQRVRAERRLRDNERRLQQAQRIARLGYWERDLESNKFHLSAQMASILGLPSERVTLGLESVLKFVHPEERGALEQVARDLVHGSEPVERRFRIVRASGEVRTVISRAEVVEEKDGRVTRLAGVLYDVSDQVRIEEALNESERRFRGAFHEAATGMAIYDREARFVQVNAAFAGMLGYEPEELADRSIMEVTHPHDIERSRGAIADLAAGRTTELKAEKRYLAKDGREVWGQVNASVLRFDGATPTQFIAQIQDVTERKKGQEELRREQEKFSRLFEISPLGIAVSRLEDGLLVDVNPALTQLLGYRRED